MPKVNISSLKHIEINTRAAILQFSYTMESLGELLQIIMLRLHLLSIKSVSLGL
jgi:hypothetical protein